MTQKSSVAPPVWFYNLAYRLGLYRNWHKEKPVEELVSWQQAGRLPGKTVLELGCGGATNGIWLAQRGYQVTALDYSEQALRVAARNAKAQGVKLELAQRDVTLPDESLPRFDVVFDRQCLQDIMPEGRPAYLDNLRRWVAPGGTFILVISLVREGNRDGHGPLIMTDAEVPRLLSDFTLQEPPSMQQITERNLVGQKRTWWQGVFLFRRPASS